MTEFAYLSVLLSIILGLAVTQILQGWRARMIYRSRVRGYWPTEVWSVLILLICTQMWWAMFGLRDQHDWTYGEFVALLGQTVFIYLSSALIYPDFWAHETVDLRTHYFSQAPYLFGSFCLVLLCSLVRNLWLNHSPPGAADLGFHLFFLTSSATGIFSANDRFHKAMAILVTAMFVVYVTTLFARLH